MVSNSAYPEIVDVFASGTTPQTVVDFHLSPAAQQHTLELLDLAKQDQLTPDSCRITAVNWPEAVRKLVHSRAFDPCQYWLIALSDAGLPPEIDHVIGRVLSNSRKRPNRRPSAPQ